MDPASIIGLAWTAVQIVQLGLKATSKVLEIRSVTSTDDLGSLIGPVETLLKAAGSFDDHSTTDASDDLTALGRELQSLVRNIMATIRELKIELQKSNGPTGKKQSLTFFRFWGAATRWQRIKALQEKIKEYQRALETGLLFRICELSNQHATKSKDYLVSIDSSIQDFATHLSRGAFVIASQQCETAARINQVSLKITKHINEGLEEISRAVKAEGRATREYITHIKNREREAEQKAKEDALQARQKEQLLASLRFPGMFNKENTMPEAYEKTYEWIFDPAGQHGNKWSDFGTWLARDAGIYWINGKPGAGKSTLMNFLWNHAATKGRLRQWKPRSTIVFRFFITDQESAEHRSFVGVLRALLFQLISNQDSCSSLFQLCVDSGWNQFEQEWPLKRLRTVFSAALALVNAPVCIFLDGVDELQADRRELAIWIQQVAHIPDVKLCIAGRAYDVFVRAFEGCPSLRLQDITYKDIRAYVEGCLLASNGLQSLFSSQVHMVGHLVEEVVWRADGVFLWARLAVQALLNGIDQYDSSEELFRRLSTMPPDIEKLYGHLWNVFAKDEPIYKETTIQWFETFFSLPTMGNASLVQFALAVKPTLQKTLCAEPTLLNLQRLLDATRQVQKQMISRSRGLLEVRIHETETDRMLKRMRLLERNGVQQTANNGRNPILCHREWEELDELHRTSRVSFIHRSAVEFVSSLPEFAVRLAASSKSPQLQISIFQSYLALRYLRLDTVVDDEDGLMLRTAPLVEQELVHDYDFFAHVGELYKTDSALEGRDNSIKRQAGVVVEHPCCADYRTTKLFQRGLIARYPLSRSPAAVEMLLRAGSAFAVDLLLFALKDVKGWTTALGNNVSFLLQCGVDIDSARYVEEWWQKGLGVTLFFLFVQYGFMTGTSLLTPTTGEGDPDSIIAGDVFFDKMQEIQERSRDVDQEAVLTWTGSWFHELGCPDEGAAVFPTNLVVVCIKVVDLLDRCARAYSVRRGGGSSEITSPLELTVLAFECKSRVWWEPGTPAQYQRLQHHISEALPRFGAEHDPPSPDTAQEWEDILDKMKSRRNIVERARVPAYLGLDSSRHPASAIEAFLTWFDRVYERNDQMCSELREYARECAPATPALLPKRKGRYGGVRVVRGPVWGNYTSGV